MAFFMRCCASRFRLSVPTAHTHLARSAQALRMGLAALCVAWPLASAAQLPVDTTDLVEREHAVVVQRTPEGVVLQARVSLPEPQALQDILLKGVPLQFVWAADLKQSRWYWTHRSIHLTTRRIRLAYQPLTGRWRVSASSEPDRESPTSQLAANTHALHRNVETFEEAIVAVQSVARWNLMTAEQDRQTPARFVDLTLTLDGQLLPRPFQSRAEQGVLWRGRVPVQDMVADHSDVTSAIHDEPPGPDTQVEQP